MHHLTMYLDFVSPYAWIAFQQLPHTLKGLNIHVEYRPVLLGALLHQNSNPGPVGIPSKRVWTYRHAQWLAQHLGIPMQMPTTHPFNPMPLLRLALHTSRNGCINRYVAQSIFRHVWEGGADATDANRLALLRDQLAQQIDPAPEAAEHAKHLLRSNTEAATHKQVFGVPAWEVNDQIFWGVDSLPMLRDYLDGHPWFSSLAWKNSANIPTGLA